MSATIDYPALYQLAGSKGQAYQSATPFPHIIIEDQIDPKCLEQVLAEFPGQEELKYWRRNVVQHDDVEMQIGKLGFSNEHVMSAVIRNLIWELNAAPFLGFLEQLTGIENLIPDPTLRGGGLHQIEPGGRLGIHADFTRHPIYDLDRRLNLLLFLNKDWPDDYAGHLELWSNDLSRCEKSIRPIFGRMVIFSTNAVSFHGHPQALSCPLGMTRRSVALYYYTNSELDENVSPTPDTDWRTLPEVERPPHQ